MSACVQNVGEKLICHECGRIRIRDSWGSPSTLHVTSQWAKDQYDGELHCNSREDCDTEIQCDERTGKRSH